MSPPFGISTSRLAELDQQFEGCVKTAFASNPAVAEAALASWSQVRAGQ
jgi:hypothetical protein